MLLEKRKVAVAGTFEILHPGHIALIRYAEKFGEVYVVVSRDETVEKMKGRKPVISEEQRRFMVSQLKGVKKAVLGGRGEDKLKIIEKIKPDILILGPDQPFSETKISFELRRRGLNIEVSRMKNFYNEYPLCKTSKIMERVLLLKRGK